MKNRSYYDLNSVIGINKIFPKNIKVDKNSHMIILTTLEIKHHTV